jgi:hypothetical protein
MREPEVPRLEWTCIGNRLFVLQGPELGFTHDLVGLVEAGFERDTKTFQYSGWGMAENGRTSEEKSGRTSGVGELAVALGCQEQNESRTTLCFGQRCALAGQAEDGGDRGGMMRKSRERSTRVYEHVRCDCIDIGSKNDGRLIGEQATGVEYSSRRTSRLRRRFSWLTYLRY